MFATRFGVMALLASLSWTAAVAATPTLAGSTTKPHPTSPLTLTGTAFSASEAVDVYFDTTDELLLVSSSAGALTGAVTVPASAVPGTHYITAVGRRTGDAAQFAVTVTTPWAQMGYSVARTGWNPYENVLSPSTVPTIGTLWSAAINGSGATPARDGKYAYFTTSSGIVCLNSSTGAQIWSAAKGENFVGSPTMVSSVVYAGALSGKLYAFNAGTGAIIWTTQLPGSIYASPLASKGYIYIGSYSGNFYAVKSSTGAIAWSYATGTNGVDGSAATDGTNVYIGSFDNAVYALNPTTGALMWSYTTGGHVESTPAISSGVLYIGSDDNKVYALNARTGYPIWSYTTGGAIYTPPAVANNIVYAGSADGSLYALGARDGSLFWNLATGGGIVRSPIVANGVVYASSGSDTFVAVSASTGSLLASGATGAGFFGGPSVSDGVVYFNGIGGSAYALAPNAGQLSPSLLKRAPEPSSLRPNMSLRVSPSTAAPPQPLEE